MITFGRIYRPAVTLTIAGQPVQALGLPGVQAPRVSFRVKRTMTSTPDSAEIVVYGLEETRRKAMQQIWTELGAAQAEISTGYDGVVGRLFLGDIRSLKASTQLGPEFATVVTADDGGDALADAVVPSGLASTAGVDADKMIAVALAVLNTPRPPATPPTAIVKHPSVDQAIASAPPAATTLFYSSVAIGKAKDLLDEAARVLGARWWIRDSQLFMARRGLPTDGLAVLLPRDHWLAEPVEDAAGLIKVATFLDPNIVPGRQIVLVGRVTPGVTETFRVEAAEYTGDTESGSPFRVDVDARRLVG